MAALGRSDEEAASGNGTRPLTFLEHDENDDEDEQQERLYRSAERATRQFWCGKPLWRRAWL